MLTVYGNLNITGDLLNTQKYRYNLRQRRGNVLQIDPPRRRRNRRALSLPRINTPPVQNRRRNQARGIQQRTILPTLHADPQFWSKVFNLPDNLRQFLKPDWDLRAWSTTRNDLRALIAHFKPGHHITSSASKGLLIDEFEKHVAIRYGAFYGI